MSANKRYSINDIKLPPSLVTKLSPEMLKELSKQDDETFYQFFEGLNLDDVKKIRQKYEQIQDANRELALKNVEQETRYSKLKVELVEKASELTMLKEKHDKMYTALKVIQGKKNPQAVQKELSEATKTIERESEDFASDFVSGKLSLSPEEFQEKFLEQRKLYWLRKVKTEKMKELLLNYRPTPTPRTTHKSSSESSSSVQPPPLPHPTPVPPSPTPTVLKRLLRPCSRLPPSLSQPHFHASPLNTTQPALPSGCVHTIPIRTTIQAPSLRWPRTK